MSKRDLLWFLSGASMACVIGAIMLWVTRESASLPSWHPSTNAASTTSSGTDLHTLADQMRRQRNYQAAREAYAALELQATLSADEWADYADVSASLQNGALGGEPARLIDAALKANPTHPKALWLRASLAHQQARFEDALTWWQRLRDQLPPDSPDQRIVAANIEEATRLMGGNGGAMHPNVKRTPEIDLRFGLLFQ